MIPRYSRPEMSRIWSDQNRFATWLKVEIAASEVLAERGIVPKEALRAIKERARFDVARIDAIEKEVQHDVIAFVSNVAESVGPEGRWLHYGLTSSDVVDTALKPCSLGGSLRLILQDVAAAGGPARPRPRVQARADDRAHPRGPRRPLTFGLKLALWHAELERDRARIGARGRRSW
jgi:adenylosuccinate lyase